jgi:hypothetical protein
MMLKITPLVYVIRLIDAWARRRRSLPLVTKRLDPEYTRFWNGRPTIGASG